MLFFVSFDLCWFKVYFIRDQDCNSGFFILLSISLVNLPPSLYFEPMCMLGLHVRWVSWIQYTNGFWLFIQFASLCLLIRAFSPFTFKVDVVICEFDPVILMLAGCFAHELTQFLHCVDALFHLVRFWGGWNVRSWIGHFWSWIFLREELSAEKVRSRWNWHS